MGRLRSFCAGAAASALLLVGCASFPYHHYFMEGVSFKEGKLLGPKPENDLPFDRCAPTPSDKNPCAVMLTRDFFAFKLDYEDTKEKLKTCEQQRREFEEESEEVKIAGLAR